jgi:hypothetical protein
VLVLWELESWRESPRPGLRLPRVVGVGLLTYRNCTDWTLFLRSAPQEGGPALPISTMSLFFNAELVDASFALTREA